MIIATRLVLLVAEVMHTRYLTRRQEGELFQLLDTVVLTEEEREVLDQLMEAIAKQEIQFLP